MTTLLMRHAREYSLCTERLHMESFFFQQQTLLKLMCPTYNFSRIAIRRLIFIRSEKLDTLFDHPMMSKGVLDYTLTVTIIVILCRI